MRSYSQGVSLPLSNLSTWISPRPLQKSELKLFDACIALVIHLFFSEQSLEVLLWSGNCNSCNIVSVMAGEHPMFLKIKFGLAFFFFLYHSFWRDLIVMWLIQILTRTKSLLGVSALSPKCSFSLCWSVWSVLVTTLSVTELVTWKLVCLHFCFLRPHHWLQWKQPKIQPLQS